MSIQLFGNQKVKDIYIGNKNISKVYSGNNLVFTKEWPGLKFTSQQDNSIIRYNIQGSIDKDIYTSQDGKTWTSWDGSSITLNNGEFRYIWNKKNTLSVSYSQYLYFTMSGLISASGDCDSMINFSPLSNYCYNSMFYNCKSLTTPPDLPSINLATNCYYRLFYGCTNLTTAPDLPATTLTFSCYNSMFYGCINLTTAPDLPATTLHGYCYTQMFYNCKSLTIAPDLPATTLYYECYQAMFSNCKSLTTAPELHATTLVDYCYSLMFNNCSNLSSIKLNYTGKFDSKYFNNWVYGVSSLGTFYYNGSDTTRGYSAIPTGWDIQTF